MRELSKYSEDELIEELARRKNDRKLVHIKDVRYWCDDCANFVPYVKSNDVRLSYNPCKKKHRMEFSYPEKDGDPTEGYGFYRLVCADREVTS